jgi:hypothetical protein
MRPVMRAVLPTPFGRVIRPFALLEFEGRHSGHRYAIPVGYHDADGERVVFTPAAWRANFRGGIPVTISFRGRKRRCTGTLVDDPDVVAALLRSVAGGRGGSLGIVGIKVPDGHEVTAADVLAVDRQAIRFS